MTSKFIQFNLYITYISKKILFHCRKKKKTIVKLLFFFLSHIFMYTYMYVNLSTYLHIVSFKGIIYSCVEIFYLIDLHEI